MLGGNKILKSHVMNRAWKIVKSFFFACAWYSLVGQSIFYCNISEIFTENAFKNFPKIFILEMHQILNFGGSERPRLPHERLAQKMVPEKFLKSHPMKGSFPIYCSCQESEKCHLNSNFCILLLFIFGFNFFQIFNRKNWTMRRNWNGLDNVLYLWCW